MKHHVKLVTGDNHTVIEETPREKTDNHIDYGLH